MNELPVRILGIAPYEGMMISMERAAELYPNVCLDAFVGDLEDGTAIVKQNLYNGYDCIISRGGTAEFIQKITDIPVVEIHLSVYDVLRGIKLAENYEKKYAIVGFPSITKPAHILCDLLRIPLEIHTIHNTEEAYTTLEQLRMQGCCMVVGDMITHTAARQIGMDSFLMTSGIESLQEAIEKAVILSAGFRRMRRENMFLHCVTREERGAVAVLDDQGNIYYCMGGEPAPAFLQYMQEKISEIPDRAVLRFFYNDDGNLYTVSAQTLNIAQSQFYLFYYMMSKIPLRSAKQGVRSYNCNECKHLFHNSFYSISGAMGAMNSTVTSIAATRQPVMILGENGTGKEQIARYLYLHSPFSTNPIIVINCELAGNKTWDFLLNHYNSPFNDADCTIYIQHLEMISPARSAELLSLLLDTGLQRRQRLIFSSICQEGEQPPDVVLTYIQRLGCLSLRLPALRSRKEEISSLASLYLGSLNQEIGTQIAGFEPRAIEQLRAFEWPNNYTQFRKVLQSLAVITKSSYINTQDVAEILAQEREFASQAHKPEPPVPVEGTLEEIICNVIRQTIEAKGGNQTAAAKQLGISRTTMWRHLNQYPKE